MDLEASGIQLQQTGSTYTVTWTTGVSVEPGGSPFSFTVTLKQYRNGQLVDTLVDESYDASEDSINSCENLGCTTTVCGQAGQCRINVPTGQLLGSCKYKYACTGGTWKCWCTGSQTGSEFEVQLESGDILTLSIDPGSGVTDVDTLDNTFTTET